MAIHTNLIPTLIYALLRTIVSSIIALCGVSFLVGKTLGESYRFILSRCSDAMLARGTLHGEEYVGAGLFLAAVKISLDFAVHSLLSIFSGNDVARTPVFGFWFMEIPATVGELLPLVPYIILALPFCWLGIGLTLARLRDARLPSPWILLFFVPAVNMLLFTILCVIPSASSAETDSSEDATWIPKSRAGIAVSSIALTSALGLVTILVGAGIFKSYGTPLFMGLPFMLGFISSSLYSIATKRTLRECLGISFLCLVAVGILLVALMVEGIICLAVLFPIAALLSSIGALFGYAIQASRPRKREIILSTHLGWLAIFPLVAIPVSSKEVFPLTTSIEINAPAEIVWQNVVSFSELPNPNEWLFIHGIAYPKRARIEGSGVGAIRYCEFSTGPFVEPITVWNEPHELRFSVESTPPALEEWNPFGHVVTAHMNGFFISHGGQFLLTALPGNRTRIDATTWYSHHVAPAQYWKLFSDPILHMIHSRVLEHIKALSESAT